MIVKPGIFSPGAAAVIEFRNDPKVKYTTFFRGYKSKQFILLDRPRRRGELVVVAEDDRCVVRFIHEGEVIGFRSRVLSVAVKPQPLLFLMYPDQVESSRLRKADRYPVKIAVVLSASRVGGLTDAYPRYEMLNISYGGCMIESLEEFQQGDTIYITVFLPEQGRIDDLPAEVKRVEKHEDSFRLGVAFTDASGPGYEQIRGFVHMLETFQVRA